MGICCSSLFGKALPVSAAATSACAEKARTQQSAASAGSDVETFSPIQRTPPKSGGEPSSAPPVAPPLIPAPAPEPAPAPAPAPARIVAAPKSPASTDKSAKAARVALLGGAPVAPPLSHKGIISSIVADGSGTKLFVSSDKALTLWHGGSGATAATWTKDDGVRSFFVSAFAIVKLGGDEFIITNADNDDIVMRDLAPHGAEKLRKHAHAGGVTAIALRDGKDIMLASGGRDKLVCLWRVTRNNGAPALGAVATLTGHTGFVSALEWLGATRLASGSSDRSIRIWDTAAHAAVAELRGHTGDSITALTALAGGRYFASAGGKDETLRLWAVASTTGSAAVATAVGHIGPVLALAALSDGRFASAGADKSICIWRVTEGQRDGEVGGSGSGGRGTVACALVAALGDPIIDARGGGGVNYGAGRPVSPASGGKGHSGDITALAALGRGLIASAGKDMSVRVWAVPN